MNTLFKLISSSDDPINYIEVGEVSDDKDQFGLEICESVKDELRRASLASLDLIGETGDPGFEATRSPLTSLEFVCKSVAVPPNLEPEPGQAPKRRQSIFQKTKSYVLRNPKEYPSKEGAVFVQRSPQEVVGKGAFGEARTATGYREMGGYKIKTFSTKSMIIKTQTPDAASANLLLAFREYWFGRAIFDAYSDDLEDAPPPCPKPISMTVKEVSDLKVKTELVQTKAAGVPLDTLLSTPDLSIKIRYRICYAVLSQLMRLHAIGINHNDLNPSNVIVNMSALIKASTADEVTHSVTLIDLGRTIFTGTTPGGLSDPFRDKIGGIRFYLSPTQSENLTRLAFNESVGEDRMRITPITSQDELISFGILMVQIISSRRLNYCELGVENQNFLRLNLEIKEIPLGYGNNARPMLSKLFSTTPSDRPSEAEMRDFLREKMELK